ncbi:MAG: PIN domain-containing protein [Phototrophicaceae bacterium]
MSIGIVDTTVILHYFRKNESARSWLNSQTIQLSVTSISWLEVMEGTSNKINQEYSKSILSQFEILYVNNTDQIWAMQQLEKFQFSHHIGIHDCLIASIAYRLQVPLYTHNLKDMFPLIGTLAVKPY